MEKLKEGEVICPKCHAAHRVHCDKCWGEGKLDWIEAIVGRKRPDHMFVLPKARNVYPALLAKDLVSVQLMEAPSIVKFFVKDTHEGS